MVLASRPALAIRLLNATLCSSTVLFPCLMCPNLKMASDFCVVAEKSVVRSWKNMAKMTGILWFFVCLNHSCFHAAASPARNEDANVIFFISLL